MFVLKRFLIFPGSTSSEWYWRIIDAISKLSVNVNPTGCEKKVVKILPIYPIHYENIPRCKLHTNLISKTALPVFRIYQLYSILDNFDFLNSHGDFIGISQYLNSFYDE